MQQPSNYTNNRRTMSIILAVAPLGGRAAQYLTALAMVMTEAGSVTVTEQTARGIVSKVSAKLREEGQIANVPEPLDVIAGLTAHHLLEKDAGFRGYSAVRTSAISGILCRIASRKVHQGPREPSNQARGYGIYEEVHQTSPPGRNHCGWLRKRLARWPPQEPEDADAVKAGALLVSCAFDCDPVFGGEISAFSVARGYGSRW